jgi:hypothetical protein
MWRAVCFATRFLVLLPFASTVARYHFKYVLMNPNVHPDVREALTREVEHRSIKTGKKISLATLKANKFYDRETSDACDKNWVHIAEHRDAWREFVVKAAKFHYSMLYNCSRIFLSCQSHISPRSSPPLLPRRSS